MLLHTLSPGETLYSVARAYGVPPMHLASDNGILTPERLPPGMVLLLLAEHTTPSFTSSSDLISQKTPTLIPNEVLYG